VLSNLQKLISGAGMECTYRDQGMTVTSYLKGEGRIRSEYKSGGKDMISILNGDTLYFGEKGKSVWFTMKMEEGGGGEETQSQGGYNMDYTKVQEEINKWDCRPTTVDDRMFQPPAGVKLMDLSNPSDMMGNAEALSEMYGRE
jgi:hypothetical protein